MSEGEGEGSGGLHQRKPVAKPRQTDLLARAANTSAPPAPPDGHEQIALHHLLRKEENKNALNKLIMASFVMFTLPLLCFFFFSNIHYLGVPWDENFRTTVGAVGAVVTVNVVIAGYVIMAFREDI